MQNHKNNIHFLRLGDIKAQMNVNSIIPLASLLTPAKVYVADLNNSRTQKFTNDGDSIIIWGSLGNAESQFNIPSGVTIDSSGNVYVSDLHNNRIQKFTSDGKFITMW